MCLNKKVIGGLVAAALAIYLFVPDLFGAALPLLILAVCPLSMLLMMRMMSGSTKGSTDTEGSSGDVDELAQLRGEVDRLRAEQGAQRTASETPDLR